MTLSDPTLSDAELDRLLNEIGVLPKSAEKKLETKESFEEILKKISIDKRVSLEKNESGWLLKIFILIHIAALCFLSFCFFSLKSEVDLLREELNAIPSAALHPSYPKEEIIQSLDGESLYKKTHHPI